MGGKPRPLLPLFDKVTAVTRQDIQSLWYYNMSHFVHKVHRPYYEAKQGCAAANSRFLGPRAFRTVLVVVQTIYIHPVAITSTIRIGA